jgi:hypothetical protein
MICPGFGGAAFLESSGAQRGGVDACRYPVETRKQVVELARTGTRLAQLTETAGGRSLRLPGEPGPNGQVAAHIAPCFLRALPCLQWLAGLALRSVSRGYASGGLVDSRGAPPVVS